MNRRQSKLLRSLARSLVRLWQRRGILFLVFSYLILLGWLCAAGSRIDLRPGEFYGIPDNPAWTRPDSGHWFGTTGNGTDLFELSRLAMATSVSLAVVAVSLGITLALLVTMLFVLDRGEKRFALPNPAAWSGFALPPFVVLVILAGGSGGSLGVTLSGLIFVIAFHLCPVLMGWFQEGENGFDVIAAYALGLSRRDIMVSRILPGILPRLIGLFATFVPAVVLIELALSFLGLSGDRLSCGAMVAYGQTLILEAPWMAVCPGLMATLVVTALSLLGWRVSAALRTGPVPRLF